MSLTRREWLGLCAVGPAFARSPMPRVGVMDGIIGMARQPASCAKAADLGADAVQVTLGRDLANFDSAAWLQAARDARMPLVSTYLDLLHADCLKNDQQAREDVRQAIAVNQQLRVRILMIVFFGKCALNGPDDDAAVTAALRDVAPTAEKAGITLGFENTISAERNIKILDAVGSPALKVFYDIGNATNVGGFDPAREIRLLGDRICQFHFKDKTALGQGKVNVRAALEAVRDIDFQGYIMLETSGDVRPNLNYVRQTMKDVWR